MDTFSSALTYPRLCNSQVVGGKCQFEIVVRSHFPHKFWSSYEIII